MTVISGPVPPYSNPPINPQYFQPSVFFISNVSLGVTTTVTTSVNHNYVIGQLVRLLIPIGYGCRLLNGQSGNVIAIPAANQVVISINSQGSDPFVDAGLSNKPRIIAVGDINQGIISSTGRSIPTTNIPGSFINISPL